VAPALVDSDTHPPFHDVTADFVYARLRRTVATEPEGYPAAALDAWAARFHTWAKGGTRADAPPVQPRPKGTKHPRDCFVYLISGAKERAPAAAMALLQRLSQ
jgi:uncharacterized protein YecE (DUF72 family)